MKISLSYNKNDGRECYCLRDMSWSCHGHEHLSRGLLPRERP